MLAESLTLDTELVAAAELRALTPLLACLLASSSLVHSLHIVPSAKGRRSLLLLLLPLLLRLLLLAWQTLFPDLHQMS